MFYILFLPIMAIQLFALLAIPVMLRPGLRTLEVGKALFSYASQTAGILLMSLGGLPTLYSVLASEPLTAGTYTALLLIFAVGGLTFLWHDSALHHIDAAAKAVPRMIFACAWKFLGLLIVLFSLLSLVLNLTIGGAVPSQGWWIMHVALIFYGILLTYTNFAPPATSTGGFRTQAMAGASSMVKKKKK